MISPRNIIDDQGADRHAQLDVVGALAVAVGAAARFAVPRLVHLGVTEVDQGVDIAVGHGPDRAALAAIAAVRSAERAKLFAAE